MMLEHLGERAAAARMVSAIEATTKAGIGVVPGKDKTETIARAVLERLV